jgi:hypothetical protein
MWHVMLPWRQTLTTRWVIVTSQPYQLRQREEESAATLWIEFLRDGGPGKQLHAFRAGSGDASGLRAALLRPVRTPAPPIKATTTVQRIGANLAGTLVDRCLGFRCTYVRLLLYTVQYSVVRAWHARRTNWRSPSIRFSLNKLPVPPVRVWTTMELLFISHQRTMHGPPATMIKDPA